MFSHLWNGPIIIAPTSYMSYWKELLKVLSSLLAMESTQSILPTIVFLIKNGTNILLCCKHNKCMLYRRVGNFTEMKDAYIQVIFEHCSQPKGQWE